MTQVVAISGGVGGAKLVYGLSQCSAADQLSVVVNVGDDFEHLGLLICPDIDTVIYTLAGKTDVKQGWGLADETWHCLERLSALQAPDWFRLGDRDLATHLYRRWLIDQGQSLTQVTQRLAQQMNVAAHILPVSDEPVRTRLNTNCGEMDFQHYFVKHQCKPLVAAVHFDGANQAMPSDEVVSVLHKADVVIICPSNPVVSIGPMLAINHLQHTLRSLNVPVIVVSPLVQGKALKGPTEQMMHAIYGDCSLDTLVGVYQEIADVLIIDTHDAHHKRRLSSSPLTIWDMPIVMHDHASKLELARMILERI